MAKRMALVPMDIMNQMKEMPLLNQLSNLDKEMESILRDTAASNDMKFLKYQDTLRRYQQLTDVRDQPLQPIQPVQSHPVNREKVTLPSEQIIRNMPVQKQRSAKILLDFLATVPELSVNDRNEIVIDGNVVRKSNIHDLVSDLTRDQRGPTPRGFNELAHTLKTHNVPLMAIGSTRRRNTFAGEPPSSVSSKRSRQPSNMRTLSIEDFPSHSAPIDDDDEWEVSKPRKKSRRVSAQGPQQNYAKVQKGYGLWENV